MHECPNCYGACYCGGDIDDMLIEGSTEEAGCSCCDGSEDFDDDNEDGARSCDHASTHEEAGGFVVCSDCGAVRIAMVHSSERLTPNKSLSDLVAGFLNAAGELRWRLSDTPNPTTEDEGGNCRHDEAMGCSWRCTRRTKAERVATHDEVRAYIRARVGVAAFCYLDGIGESASSIEIEPLIEALVVESEGPESSETEIRTPTDEEFRQAAAIAHPVFVANGWTWGLNAHIHIPTRDEIEQRFRELTTSVVDGDIDYCASGRLRAWRMYWRPGDIDVRLSVEMPVLSR